MSRRIILRTLAGVSLLGITGAAAAQDMQTQNAPAEASGNQVARGGADAQNNQEGVDAGDTIVVTARRRNEDLQDVPLVVNAVTQEEVEKLNFRNFQEVQNVVPGLNLQTQANGTGGNVSLRGVNFDVNASGFNPTVEFYLNDAPITSGVVLQSLFDVGQIEVLRGPQGTLRGRASPSGSIILTTRRANLDEIGGNIVTSANNIGTINVNGGIGIPIIPGVAAIRVAGVFERSDSDRVRTINGSVDRRDPFSETRGGRITGRIEPTDFLSFEGTYQKLRRDNRAFDQVASFSEVNPAAAASPVFIGTDDRLGFGAAPRRVRQDYDIYNGQAQAAFAGQRLIYVFQHYKQQFNSYNPTDNANRFSNLTYGQVLETRAKTTSHEVRLQNEDRVFDMFDYVIGGLDIKNDVPSDFVQATPVTLGGRVLTIAQTPIVRLGESHEQSLFGNLTGHFGDKIEVSGGARYITYKSNGSLIINRSTVIPDPEIDDDHVIYSGSIKYTVSPDLMIYANTGSSYRPAIFAVGDFSARQSTLERSFLALPPETSKSYELGFKSTLFDRRLRLNGTVYHQDFKNYPFRSPNNGVYYVNFAATPGAGGSTVITPTVTQFNFVSAVPVDVNGVEGEIAFSASDRWDISLIGSYALGKIKNGVTPCTDLNGDGVPDNVTTAPTLAQLQAAVGANNLSACRVTQRSSFSPPFTATLQSEYRVPLSPKVDSYLRGLFTYYGKSQADPTSTFDNVDSFGLLNLYAGLRDPDGQWELSFFAKNLFNVEKALSRSTPLQTSFQVLNPLNGTTTASNFTSSYTGVTTTPLREFGLNLRFNFGSR